MGSHRLPSVWRDATLTAVRLTLRAPDDFSFRHAVCSHGFFVLAPNRWDRVRGVLRTVITLDDTTAVPIEAAEDGNERVRVTSPVRVSTDQRKRVGAAVARMLRLDERFAAFHARCLASATHRTAADLRFGRLLRSPTLFEDIVKVICTCNTAWRQTVAMVDHLVRHWGVPVEGSDARGFPTAERLASVRLADLKEKARVGYRAESLHRLAREVADGRLDLTAIERFAGPTGDLFHQLKRIHGVGDYAAGHLCMLLGRYDRLAVDTEAVRFLKDRHPRRKWTPATIRDYYAAWHPFEFLAYWFELWQDYVRQHGESDQWEPEVTGRRITTATRR